MVEPDFDKPKPEGCNDVLILYATSEKTNYEPLTQTEIELSPKLSTRGPNDPDVRILLKVEVSRFHLIGHTVGFHQGYYKSSK